MPGLPGSTRGIPSPNTVGRVTTSPDVDVSGAPLAVYKLDPDTGKRIGELAVEVRDGKETFAINEKAKTMYFELVR